MSYAYLTPIATDNGVSPAAETYVINVIGVVSISDGNWWMFGPYFNL